MNTILYIGLALILIGFIGFIICEIKIAQLDRHLLERIYDYNKKKNTILLQVWII